MSVESQESLQPQPEYKVKPISKEPEGQAKRGWGIEINGETIDGPIESARLVNNKMGVEVSYGQRPEGYDGMVIKEPGGGGSVTIPYYLHDGQLYIGVVEEWRPTTTDGESRKILNVPRGYLDPGETHFETAVRELGEEAGYRPLQERIQELEGAPMNPNSAVFVTGKDKGVRMFGVNVTASEVVPSTQADDPTKREFRFNPDVVKPSTKMGEKISGSKFIHWTQAAGQVDMFTAAGVGRILASQAQAKGK
jgi:8-oxo-dGTP pyrophosphatase MutT (NUDIX family)